MNWSYWWGCSRIGGSLPRKEVFSNERASVGEIHWHLADRKDTKHLERPRGQPPPKCLQLSTLSLSAPNPCTGQRPHGS